ncbi:MAG: ABC transporter ATP-binding protein [Filifactor alocis]|nr:ABC transporter ATP-binding protein [Filifactor alocis]
MDTYKDRIDTSVLIKRFAPYFKRYRRILFLDLVCAFFTTVCEIVFPLMVRNITNKAITNSAQLTIDFVAKVCVLYFLLRLVDTAANYYMASVGHIMGAKIERDMRRDLFAHLQKLSFSYFDNTKIGQIMGRITSDLFEITEFAHHCPEEFFIAGVKISISFLILARTNLLLTVIVFSVIPLMLLCTIYFRRRMRMAFKRSREQIGDLNSQVEDSLLGVRVVRSFANEHKEVEKFEDGNKGLLNIKTYQYKYMAGYKAVTQFFDGLMYVTVLLFASYFMIKGRISPGDMVAYLLYVSMLLSTIRRIVEFSEQFQRGMTGIERFIEIMNQEVEIKDREDAVEIDGTNGDIRFDSVSFSYSDNDKDVLSDIDLHVKPEQKIALVGPSGSGKTTLCNLIPRFYEVSKGRILLDGRDIRDIKQESLRNQIGVVQQDVYLFSGTVFDNIEYGKLGASMEEVIEAAKKAGAHEFIMKLENGYHTYVGERGVKLSGGQKQRISIARVFLKNPPILILDEATSALDNENERIVQKSLRELAVGRTTFTIAHRLTTIQNADTILVLTENGIEESGTHRELIARKGRYYELYQLYGQNDNIFETEHVG